MTIIHSDESRLLVLDFLWPENLYLLISLIESELICHIMNILPVIFKYVHQLVMFNL